MEGNKYKSFRMQTKQLSKNVEKISTQVYNQGDVFIVDEKVQLLLIPDDHQQVVMVDNTNLLFFNSVKNFFSLRSLIDKQSKQLKKNTLPQWDSSLYDMFFFRETQELCNVEKNNKENKIKITHFEIGTDQIKQIDEHILDQNQWTSSLSIFKVNEEGLLAWCSASKDSLTLSLFSRKNGFKLLAISENPFNADLDVISIGQSRSNCIHLCVNNPKNNTDLPIMVVETINGFEQIQDVRFPKQKSGKTGIKGKIDCILNIGDFFVLDVVEEENRKCQYIYSFDTESVEDQKRPFEGEYFLAKKYVAKNKYCNWKYVNEGKEIIAQHYQLHNIRSLSVLKMLRSIDQIQEAAKDHKNAILIFGAHMSGKTTFRHYLAGDELEYVQNQGGFYQVQLKDNYQKKYSESSEKGMLILTSVTQKGVFIQIPEYNTHEQSYFKVQICTLMQQIFKNFKTLQIIITIPYEYIEDSQKNVSILTSVLKMIKLGESEVSQSISIVLTKVEDEEEATEMLAVRIEEIMELNEEIGTLVSKINQEQRIFTFKNEEPNRDLAEEILELILNTEQLPLQAEMASKIKQKIEAEGITDALFFVRSEISHYYDMLGEVMLFFSHLLVGEPKHLNQTDFRNETKQVGDELSTILETIPQASQSQKLIPILFNSLGHLKLFFQKKQERTSEKIEIIKKHLLLLADEYQILTSQGSANVLKLIVNCFIVALNLSCSSLKVQETEEEYLTFVETIKSSPYSILSMKFIPVISSLCDKAPELKDSELMASLKPYMTVSAGRVIIKTKVVPMSYNQQKSYYLKQENMLQLITSLPSNTMKLDLMIQQLLLLGKEYISDNNMRTVRYYLRQCSRVCQFHNQYLEALIFLMVIPDFLGIDLLLDLLVDYRKQNSLYERKDLLSEPESELIGELMVISRNCVRDSLVKKLIYIKTLHGESRKKATNLSQEQQKILNENLSKDGYDRYQKQLKQKTGLLFFNFKNETYKKMMDNRIKLIDACRQEESKSSFQDIQALNWVIETTPIPA